MALIGELYCPPTTLVKGYGSQVSNVGTTKIKTKLKENLVNTLKAVLLARLFGEYESFSAQPGVLVSHFCFGFTCKYIYSTIAQ